MFWKAYDTLGINLYQQRLKAHFLESHSWIQILTPVIWIMGSSRSSNITELGWNINPVSKLLPISCVFSPSDPRCLHYSLSRAGLSPASYPAPRRASAAWLRRLPSPGLRAGRRREIGSRDVRMRVRARSLRARARLPSQFWAVAASSSCVWGRTLSGGRGESWEPASTSPPPPSLPASPTCALRAVPRRRSGKGAASSSGSQLMGNPWARWGAGLPAAEVGGCAGVCQSGSEQSWGGGSSWRRGRGSENRRPACQWEEVSDPRLRRGSGPARSERRGPGRSLLSLGVEPLLGGTASGGGGGVTLSFL